MQHPQSSSSVITMRQRRRTLRDSNRFYTKSVRFRYDSLCILDDYNKKELKNLEISDKYKYPQSKYQLKRDRRKNHMDNETLIEWYDGKHNKKKI